MVKPSDAKQKDWRFWLTLAGFAFIAFFFLWQEHRAHLLGALPWLFVLACPLMHVFMHGGHGHGGPTSHGQSNSERKEERDE
ncbi:DUF2933 family protein [Modicisalibacter xianhensis]|jgi:hypothetical protein|uniref:DUF2933 family protein n=1 Tax=Modicisalibacter xianhensis TaxID=442341 RepID=A0A4R8FAE1_9GAMM|nr:DUF2933 domain-containing protein [Halomonas xianhensis]TDX22546.1 DUF2933 family protein [Halomonas xianhensis]